MLNIQYECPTCGKQWSEVYECACDSECPECGEGAITAASWTEATPEKVEQVTKPRTWLVTRTVLEGVFIEARSEAEAIEEAIGVDDAKWARSIDREARRGSGSATVCTRPGHDRSLAGRCGRDFGCAALSATPATTEPCFRPFGNIQDYDCTPPPAGGFILGKPIV